MERDTPEFSKKIRAELPQEILDFELQGQAYDNLSVPCSVSAFCLGRRRSWVWRAYRGTKGWGGASLS